MKTIRLRIYKFWRSKPHTKKAKKGDTTPKEPSVLSSKSSTTSTPTVQSKKGTSPHNESTLIQQLLDLRKKNPLDPELIRKQLLLIYPYLNEEKAEQFVKIIMEWKHEGLLWNLSNRENISYKLISSSPITSH